MPVRPGSRFPPRAAWRPGPCGAPWGTRSPGNTFPRTDAPALLTAGRSRGLLGLSGFPRAPEPPPRLRWPLPGLPPTVQPGPRLSCPLLLELWPRGRSRLVAFPAPSPPLPPVSPPHACSLPAARQHRGIVHGLPLHRLLWDALELSMKTETVCRSAPRWGCHLPGVARGRPPRRVTAVDRASLENAALAREGHFLRKPCVLEDAGSFCWETWCL